MVGAKSLSKQEIAQSVYDTLTSTGTFPRHNLFCLENHSSEKTINEMIASRELNIRNQQLIITLRGLGLLDAHSLRLQLERCRFWVGVLNLAYREQVIKNVHKNWSIAELIELGTSPRGINVPGPGQARISLTLMCEETFFGGRDFDDQGLIKTVSLSPLIMNVPPGWPSDEQYTTDGYSRPTDGLIIRPTKEVHMYHLLVAASQDAWISANFSMLASRFGNSNSPGVDKRFAKFSPELVSEIKKHPALFAIEGFTQDARVGRITDVEQVGTRINIHFAIEPDALRLPPDRLRLLANQLHIQQGEEQTTHWAIKDVDLDGVIKTAAPKGTNAPVMHAPDHVVDAIKLKQLEIEGQRDLGAEHKKSIPRVA